MIAGQLRRGTLRWGIVLGVLAISLPLLTRSILANVGTETIDGAAPGSAALTLLLILLPTVFTLVSVALVGASLVMRHGELLARADRTSAGRAAGE
jgi:hypothetical protein